MTARDSRGRFVSPDAAAAERVLQRAVEEAIERLTVRRSRIALVQPGGGCEVVTDTEPSRQILLHAAKACEPLLRGAK